MAAAKYLSAAPQVIGFMEGALRQTKGEWVGLPLHMEQWEKEFLTEAFLIDPKTRRRVYKTVLLGVPTKNGKSTIASGLALYGLVADNVDGVIEGAPEVFPVAASRGQAGVVYDQAVEMVRASPLLNPRLIAQKQSIWNPGNRGTLRALAAEAGTVHGVNPSMIIVDELHAHPNNKLLTTLQKSRAARRQPLTIIITHTGWERFGVLGQMYDRLVAHPQLEQYGDKPGEPIMQIVRDRKNGVLFWWYGWRDGLNAEDPDVWMRCNPASWVTEKFLREQIGDASMRFEDFVRFHLNGWVVSAESFLPSGAWAARGNPEMVIPRGAPVYLGLDASKKKDAGAIVVCQPIMDDEGKLLRFRMFAYVIDATDDTAPDSVIRQLEQKVRHIARRFDVREVHYDPWSFTRSADELESEGINMVEFPQTDARMHPATARFRECVVDDKLEHDADPVFARHVGQAIVRETRRGYRVDKSSGKYNIDACVAGLMALQAADNAIGRGDIGPSAGPQMVRVK